MPKRLAVTSAPEIDATISELCQAIEDLVSRRKRPEEFEGLIDEAKTLVNEWKDPRSAKHWKGRRPLFDGTSTPTSFLLAALVVVLRRDQERVRKIRTYLPNKFEALCDESDWAELRAIAAYWPKSAVKPKQKYEQKRRRCHRSFYNSIEYQFGGQAEAERGKPMSALYGLPYEPTCLDGIFAGETVNMQTLEDLFFGIERHQLGRYLKGVQNRRYDYRALAKVMESLLSEKLRKRHKKATAGRPSRPPWLNDADLRTRVLSGIQARIKRIADLLWSIQLEEADLSKLTDRELALVGSVFEHFRGYAEWKKEIAARFLAVVCRHLTDSGKK